MNQSTEYTPLSRGQDTVRQPGDLPRGLLVPPTEVKAMLEREKAKYPAAAICAVTEERMLNDWTLDYYFDSLGQEVLYRQTALGPEVLAIGFDEIRTCTNDFDPDKMKDLETWTPS